MADLAKCEVCTTPLGLERCLRCSGSQKTRSWLVFRRVCSYCLGAGAVVVCPNRASHPVPIFGHSVIPLSIADQPIDAARIKEDERQERIRASAAIEMRNRNLPPPFRK